MLSGVTYEMVNITGKSLADWMSVVEWASVVELRGIRLKAINRETGVHVAWDELSPDQLLETAPRWREMLATEFLAQTFTANRWSQ